MKYKAFISYKHSIESRRQAADLERALKRYAKPLLKPPIKIFRDEKHMVPGEGLSRLIRDGLDNSEYLLFLADRAAAQSIWCKGELEYWCKTLGRSKELIIVHIGDQIALDQEEDLIDWENTDALPPTLKPYLQSIPLYVDLSWVESREDSSLDSLRYRGIVNSISARFRGVTPEELNGEEIKIYRRNRSLRNTVIVALSVLLILSSVTTWWALNRNAYALERQKFAETQQGIAEAEGLRAQDSARVAQQERTKALLQRDSAEMERDRAKIAEENARAQQRRAEMESNRNGRIARSNHNALLATQLAKSDPTLALRIAEMNYLLYPESSTAAGIFHEIISDTHTGKAFQTMPGNRSCNTGTFSPDNRSLVLCFSGGVVALWDLPGLQLSGMEQLSEGVSTATFSPDSKQILIGSVNGTLSLFDLAWREEICFEGHQGRITSVSFSPRGQLILTGSEDGYAKVFDRSGKELLSIKHDDSVTSVAFSPNGNLILTGNKLGTILLWDLTGKEWLRRQHSGSVSSVSFSADGKRILGGWKDEAEHLPKGCVRSWDLSGQVRNYVPVSGKVTSVTLSPTGQHFLVRDGSALKLYGVVPGTFEAELLLSSIHVDQMVNFAGFSPDGQRFVAGLRDGSVKFWDLSGQEQADLVIQQGHSDAITSVVFSPTGQHILTGSEDGSAKLWRSSGELLLTLQQRGKREANPVPFTTQIGRGAVPVAFSPDGQHFLTGASNGQMNMWDLEGKEVLKFWSYLNQLISLAFSTDGNYVAAGFASGQIIIWDLAGNQISTIRNPSEVLVYSVAFTPGNNDLVAGLSDQTAKMWTLSGEEILTFEGHRGRVNSVAVSSDGGFILTGSADHTARLWNMSGEAVLTLKHDNAVNSVAFSSDGRYLLTGSEDQTARMWNTSGEELLFILCPREVNSVAFSPDGRSILTGLDDHSVKIWPSFGMQKLAPYSDFKNHYVTAVSISADGQYLSASYSNLLLREGAVKVWDRYGKEVLSLQQEKGFTSVAVSPERHYLLTGSYDKTAKLWDLSGEELLTIKHEKMVTSVAISPNGQHLLTGSYDNTARLWDLSGEELLRLEQGDVVGSVAFSPDGKHLLTGSEDGTVRLWDLSGEELLRLEQGDVVSSVAFSPDGKHLLTGTGDGTARLWDLSGEELLKLEAGDPVNSVTFSPDGQYLLTSSKYAVKVWDLRGQEICSHGLDHHNSNLVALSPDGQYYLMGSNYRLRTLGDEEITRWLTPWAYLQQQVESFSLNRLRMAGLEYTERDLMESKRRVKQWRGE